jgi:hypothetical protein
VAVAANHLSNAVHTSGEIPLTAPNGPTVIVVDAGQVDLTDPFPATDTVDIVATEGNVTVDGADGASVTIDTIEGTWTNTSSLDVIGKPITIDPGDKPAVDVSGDITSLDWRQGMAPDDSTPDFVYSSSLGSGSVTLNGLPANTQIGAIDADSGNVLDTANSDGSGAVTFSGLSSGSHTVVLDTGESPAVDNASASPDGSVTTATPTLSIDVSDPNFDPGDEVTVTWFVDGSQVDSETVTSNQTVEYTTSALTGGDHSWHVELEDSYGNTATSQTFAVNVPGVVTIREEGEPHSIINTATATILITGSNETVDKQTVTNGNISLTGLPLDEQYVVVVNAPGYYQRAIYVPSLFNQTSVFLLNESNDAVLNTFIVEDRTGKFGDPILELQKPINRSSYDASAAKKYQWTIIGGDRLGASNQYVIDLNESDRYRIRIRNGEGDERVLGEYTAQLNGTITLRVGDVTLDPSGTPLPAHSAVRTNETGAPVRVTFEYNDSQQDTTTLWLKIHEYNNASNVLLANTSFTSGPYGTFNYVKDVPSAQNETTWVVQFVAVRDGAENIRGRVIVGPNQPILPDMPQWLVTIIFVGCMWMVAGLFSQLNGHIGGIVVAGLGAVFFFVDLAPPELGAGVMVLSLITGGIIFLRESRGGL